MERTWRDGRKFIFGFVVRRLERMAMLDLTPHQRTLLYKQAFPKYPPLRSDDRWIDGLWVLGNNYKGSGYYGAYPPQYLKRMKALYPDAERVLHACSGSLKAGPYTRVDILPPGPTRRIQYR